MDNERVVRMRVVNRRRFLQLAGGSVAATMLSDSIARALAIPANHATRSIEDVEHIVVLMQENRSFDHYFGVMRGVRGFGDPHPVTLPSGEAVWHQADGATVVPPFRPDVGNLALTFIEDLDHSWAGSHQMFNDGKWDLWLPSKTTTCMAHMKRDDLPFHYALADAFTVCDGYYCSMLGPTDPNRYYMWTGWDGNDGKGGGPVIENDELGYGWTTYPERLQAAGISWKIYQDSGVGLDQAGFWGWTSDPYIGNYGDNSLLYFFNYQNAAPGSPLYQAARTGTEVNKSGGFFDILADDVQHDRLPSVSWIVAPEAYTEHPAWPAGYGAWYTAGVLNALTSNPEVWSKTALLITFDENDGFFDHPRRPVSQRRRSARRVDRGAGQRAVRRQGRDAGGLRRRRRSLRPRGARAAPRGLAVEQRWLGLLGDVRPLLADPLRRGAVRHRRAQHHAVATRRLRRPDLGLRLQERVASRPAAAERRGVQAQREHDPAELPP